jgi:hypothetical protein
MASTIVAAAAARAEQDAPVSSVRSRMVSEAASTSFRRRVLPLAERATCSRCPLRRAVLEGLTAASTASGAGQVVSPLTALPRKTIVAKPAAWITWRNVVDLPHETSRGASRFDETATHFGFGGSKKTLAVSRTVAPASVPAKSGDPTGETAS